MYTKAKMVGKRSPFTDQIRSYIKNCCILGIQCFVTQSGHCTSISETEKGCRASASSLFARSSPCDFFLFLRLKKHLAGRKYQTRKNLGSAILYLGLAIFQCLNSIPRKDYENAFENWIKRLKLCVSHGGEYFEGLR